MVGKEDITAGQLSSKPKVAGAGQAPRGGESCVTAAECPGSGKGTWQRRRGAPTFVALVQLRPYLTTT